MAVKVLELRLPVGLGLGGPRGPLLEEGLPRRHLPDVPGLVDGGLVLEGLAILGAQGLPLPGDVLGQAGEAHPVRLAVAALQGGRLRLGLPLIGRLG